MIFNKTIEDYLRAVYRVRERDGEVANLALARELGVTPAAASEMARRLAEADLLRVERYRGVELTAAGERAAVAITRRHRLWEVFLIHTLGFAWDEVHNLADELEHIGDERLVDRLEVFLGVPEHDPHGDPIPRRGEKMPPRSDRAVADIAPGEWATVARVSDEHADLLRYAASLGLRPGAQIAILEQIAFDGSVRLRTEQGEAVVSAAVARSVFVRTTAGVARKSAARNTSAKKKKKG